MTPRYRLSIIAAGLASSLALGGCAYAWRDRGPDPLAGDVNPEVAQVMKGRISPYCAEAVPALLSPSRHERPAEPEPAPEPPREPEPVPAPSVQAGPPASPPPLVAQQPSVAIPAEANALKPEEPLLTALRCLLDKRPDEAILLLKQYDRPNQDMLLGVLALTVWLTQGSLDRADPREVSNVLEQLKSLAALLQPQAALSIEKMCFCRDISGFGAYEPLPPGYQFQAGREGRSGEEMKLYVELENLTSKARGSHYETRLEIRLEIRDRGGKRIWGHHHAPKEPECSYTVRRDYYIAPKFLLPAELPRGVYSFWIEVRDVTGQPGKEPPPHRIARRSLDFQVAATPRAHTTARPAP